MCIVFCMGIFIYIYTHIQSISISMSTCMSTSRSVSTSFRYLHSHQYLAYMYIHIHTHTSSGHLSSLAKVGFDGRGLVAIITNVLGHSGAVGSQFHPEAAQPEIPVHPSPRPLGQGLSGGRGPTVEVPGLSAERVGSQLAGFGIFHEGSQL